ncbi:hypothetical protein CEP54_009408 [Fusarium duplospermum]|uniref:Uncharacterized protein n=1 Tax=Fusarium duplospermum TaxID=1325734 RepID=A0A428PQN7_9HYPO|nr:hypothetical protein CEP54_009408 [Fusarium duplospermum]
MASTLVASSSTSGFFQQLPTIQPQYTYPQFAANKEETSDDAVLTRLVNQYLPPVGKEVTGKVMHEISRTVLEPAILKHAVEAETVPPSLQPLTTFGELNKNDPLVLCQGWKALKAVGIQTGVVSTAYDKSISTHKTMLLAQTPKGLSAFCVPMRREAGTGSELNGIRIQRLKNKMGTKGLPTAELELQGPRGWLVGEEGKGIKEI